MEETGTKVLIVENEALIGWSIANALKKAGFIVSIVDSGEKAIEELNLTTFDLVITDLKLPRIDGFEVASNVKKISLQIPVLMMTATDKQTVNDASCKTNIDGIIEKPFDLNEITALAHKLTNH